MRIIDAQSVFCQLLLAFGMAFKAKAGAGLDLVPLNVQAPGSAVTAQPVQIIVTVTNRGDGPAIGTWFDRIYISSDATLNVGDLEVAVSGASRNIAAGSSYKITNTFNAPILLTVSNYLIIGVNRNGDIPEPDHSNNALAVPISILAPDLMPVRIEAPASAITGQPITIVTTVTNRGVGDAIGTWIDRFYVSDDAELGAGDEEIAISYFSAAGNIPAGGSYKRTNNIPTPAATGVDRFLIARINWAPDLFEPAGNNILAVPISISAAGAIEAPEGLVGWWRGEGSGADLLNAGPGVEQGGVSYAPGKVGQAFSFGTSGAVLRIPIKSWLDVGKDLGWTVEFWMMPNGLGGSRPLFNWASGSPNAGVTIYLSDVARVACFLNSVTDENTNFMTPESVVQNSAWQHVAVTFDKGTGTIRIFVNGQQAHQSFVPISDFRSKTTGDIILGYQPTGFGSSGQFSGSLDEVSLYNRALAGAEIQAIHNAGAAGKIRSVKPKIFDHPSGGSWLVGDLVTLSAAAGGTHGISYQWFRNGQAVAGATNTNLTLSPARTGDSGVYSVRVTGAAGSITSAPASLLIYWQTNLIEVQAGALTSSGGSTGGIAAGDYNNDGWTDVFVANHFAPGSNYLFRNEKNGGFSTVTTPMGTSQPTRVLQGGEMYQGSYFVDYNNDGWLDLFVTCYEGGDGLAGENIMYRNTNGTLEQFSDGGLLTEGNGRTDSACWADLDGDRFLDVVMASRTGYMPIFRNVPGGVFMQKPGLPAVNAISVSLGDVDGDRDLDVLAGGENGVKLFRNLGGFVFQEITGTGMTMDGQALNSTHFVDWDGDGDLDIGLSSFDGLRRLYRNDGTNAFTLIGEGDNHGLVYADLNLDGQLEAYDAGVICDLNNDHLPDMIVTRYNGQSERLWTNKWNGAAWSKVKLKGVVSNPSGIGAKVRAKAVISGEEKWQTRQITAGEGYHGAMPAEAYFGFGDAAVIETLRVEWPSGATTELNDVPINQAITVEEFAEGTPIVRVNGVFSGANIHWMSNALPVQITIQSTYPTIYFSTNGLADATGTEYTGPFMVQPPVTIHATAFDEFFSEGPFAQPIQIVIIPRFALTNLTTGGGAVDFDPPLQNYLSNTVVTAIPTALPGWTFLRWELDGQPAGEQVPFVFNMDRNRSIRAIFGTTLDVRMTAGQGTAFKRPLISFHDYGSQPLAWMIPSSDRYFVRWAMSGNPSLAFTNNPYSLTLTNTNVVLNAVTALLNGKRSLTVLWEGEGTVTRSPQLPNYSNGDIVQLKATPAEGSQFMGWSGNGNFANPLLEETSVTMTENKVVTATFVKRPVVRLIQPLAGSVLNGAISNLIQAEVTVEDGSLQNVKYFKNGEFLVEGGLSVNWMPGDVAPGPYALTAVATSTRGVSATSAPVNVTVGLPPTFRTPLQSLTVPVGQLVGWNPDVIATLPVYAEWRRGNPETNYYYSFESMGTALGRASQEVAGTYRLFLSNAFGSVLSPPLNLMVIEPGFALPGIPFGANVREAGAGVSVAQDGTTYIATHTNLWARRFDGTTKWSFPGDMASSPAIAPDGTVFIQTKLGVKALDPEDGNEKWQYPSGSNMPGVSIGSDGTIYFADGRYIDAFPSTNGLRKWRFTAATTVSEPLSIGSDGTIYAVDIADNLYAINPDATQNFKTNIANSDGGPVPLPDGGVVIGSAVLNLRAYSLNSGEVRWTATRARAAYTPVIGRDGTIYCGSGTKVYAVNPNGSDKWERTIGGNIGNSAVADANGYIYFIVVNQTGNHLHIFKENGDSISTNALPNWAPFDPPVLMGDSLLYISSETGLVPYVAHSAAADSPWPMYRKSPTAHGNAGGLPGDLKWKWMADTDIYQSPMMDSSGKLWIAANNKLMSFTNGTPISGPGLNSAVSPVGSSSGLIFETVISEWYPWQSTFAVYDSVGQQEIFSQIVAGHAPDSATAVNDQGKAFFVTYDEDSGRLHLHSWTGNGGLIELGNYQATGASSPVLLQDGIVVGAGRWLYKISYSDGSLIRVYDVVKPEDLGATITEGGVAMGPEGQIYVSSYSAGLYALRPDFTEIWVKRALGYQIDTPPVVGRNGVIYVQIRGNLDGDAYYLQAFDPANGNPKWANPIALTPDYIYSTPTVTDDGTIYATGGRLLYAIRDLGNACQLRWRFLSEKDVIRSSPLVDQNGTVYYGSTGGSVYAVKGSSAATGSWPMFRGNVARTGSAVPFNSPPTISITSPLATAVLYAPASVTIKVSANDANGFVKRVDFYDGEQLLGSSTSSPFDFSTTLSAGNHTLKARAIDNGDAEGFSAVLNLSVNPPAKPVVQLLAPAASDPFQAPTNIFMLSQATDADGTISRVEFYALSVGLLGSVNGPTSSNLYSFVWTNPPAGTHTLVARAYDNNLTFTDATGVNVTVAPAVATAFRIGSGPTVQENAGTVTLTVFKDGGTAATVNFATTALTALAGRDFVAAQGSLSFGATEGSKTLQIQLLNDYVVEPDKTFEVRLVSSSAGTSITAPVAQVTIQDDDAALANSSLIDFRLSANRPASGGLRIALAPSAAVGAWRFPWEYAWRANDSIATDLDQGDYPIEFRPSVGYVAPSIKTNGVTGGTTNSFFHQYGTGGSQGSGSLQVLIGNVTEVSQNGVVQWRLAGGVWRASGEMETGLAPGIYVVEFSDVVPFWITPSAREVLIQDGVGTTMPVNYSRATPPPAGVATPFPLTYSQVRNGQIRPTDRRPYPMVGQLRSPAGFGSGTAVRDRVVLTAAHVLFDETTTNFVDPSSVMWFQERMAGEYEPRPLYAAGFYVNTNYLHERTLERKGGAQPGVAGKASQQWDVAAVYFNEPVARGGQTGYLLSDSTLNEWLIGFKLRELVGYPLFDQNRGRMHRTSEDTYVFSYESGTSNLFLSADFLSYPGNSGGPMFASFTSGQGFFPAGVYLGSRSVNGTSYSVVRAIDSMVASLINRAQSSAELGGQNFAGGGVDKIGGSGLGTLVPSTLIVMLEPAGARAAGAKWHVVGSNTGFLSSGQSFTSLDGQVDLEFSTAAGYVTPAIKRFSFIGGNLTNTLTITYGQAPTLANPLLTAERKLRFSINTVLGLQYVVESTTQIQTGAIWAPVVTNVAPFTFESPFIAPGEKKFYRARLHSN